MISIWTLAPRALKHINDISLVYIIILFSLYLYFLLYYLIIEPYIFSYKYYLFWVLLALFQGAVEFVISYLTYSYSYDVLSKTGRQTGCEMLGLMIISINIWGNLFISSRIYYYYYYYISIVFSFFLFSSFFLFTLIFSLLFLFSYSSSFFVLLHYFLLIYCIYSYCKKMEFLYHLPRHNIHSTLLHCCIYCCVIRR